MREIWLELKRLVDAGTESALVTVLRTEGSAYQREGTKMLYAESAEPIGTISGGCLEADLFEHCRTAIRRSGAKIVTYSPGMMADTVFGLGSGCLGTIEVLIESLAGWRTAEGRALLDEIVRRVAHRVPFAVVTLLLDEEEKGSGVISRPLFQRVLVDADGNVLGATMPTDAVELAKRALSGRDRRPSRCVELSAAGRRALVDVTVPPLRVLVFGAGEDARPLVAIASEAGMEVTVVDWRSELLDPKRFPNAAALVRLRPEEFPGCVSLDDGPAVVLMSHGYEADRAVMQRIQHVERMWDSRQELAYLGILGPRSRTSRLLADIGASDSLTAAVRTPAGLDLGADTPGEIALSIVAEILAVRRRRRGVPLSRPSETAAVGS